MATSRTTTVRYTVKPEHAQHNEELVRAVYRGLAETSPEGLRYATFRLDDGVTFVHLASVEPTEGPHPLLDLPAFREFQAGLDERCAMPPTVTRAETIGAFGWLDDRDA